MPHRPRSAAAARAAVLLALLAVLPALAAPAGAQTLSQPVEGSFEEIYLVAGRAIDARGLPAAGAELTVELAQPGIRAAPLKATANCKGDFITYFTLRNVTSQGSVTVTLHGRDGVADARESERFDPFFRRSDLTLQLPGEWRYACPANEDVWPVSVSVAGRIVDRTEPRDDAGAVYDAAPHRGRVRLRYVDEQGGTHCPPAGNAAGGPAPLGVCDYLRVDERGDFRYTFVFGDVVSPNGTMHLVLEDNRTFSAPVDPLTRQAVLMVETTGRGAPPPAQEAPGPAPLAVLALLAGIALLARRRLARR